MKIAVFSDTHGSTARMLSAAEALRPDALVHLGDYERDADCLAAAFPEIPLYRVCGNCDVAPAAPQELVVEFGPVRATPWTGDDLTRWCTRRRKKAARSSSTATRTAPRTRSSAV